MGKTIYLNVASLEKRIFAGTAKSVIVNGALGELAILPDHAALLTTIRPGQIRILLPHHEEELYYISGGILEVQKNIVTILADMVVRAAELDEAAAIAARENAKRILESRKANLDVGAAVAELTQAVAQLRTIRLINKKRKDIT